MSFLTMKNLTFIVKKYAKHYLLAYEKKTSFINY